MNYYFCDVLKVSVIDFAKYSAKTFLKSVNAIIAAIIAGISQSQLKSLFSFLCQYLFLMPQNLQNSFRASNCKLEAIARWCVDSFSFRFLFPKQPIASSDLDSMNPSKVPRRHSVALVGHRATALYRISAKSACALWCMSGDFRVRCVAELAPRHRCKANDNQMPDEVSTTRLWACHIEACSK